MLVNNNASDHTICDTHFVWGRCLVMHTSRPTVAATSPSSSQVSTTANSAIIILTINNQVSTTTRQVLPTTSTSQVGESIADKWQGLEKRHAHFSVQVV